MIWSNYANDTDDTFHAFGSDLDVALAVEWFESNYLKLNRDDAGL